MRNDELYLTDKQYLDLLKRIRADLDGIDKIIAVDSTTTGNKHTFTNVGVCAGYERGSGWAADKYVTEETALWPDAFNSLEECPQKYTMKYKAFNQTCPLDMRLDRSRMRRLKYPESYGCFYHCRAFHDKSLTIEKIKELYDEMIRRYESR